MSIIEDAYRKSSTDRFPLPSEEQLAELESRVRVVLPQDYRQFVLQQRRVFQRARDYTGRRGMSTGWPDLPPWHRCVALGGRTGYLALFDYNDPPIILPIGQTSMGGLIILTTEAEGRGEILLKQAFGDFH